MNLDTQLDTESFSPDTRFTAWRRRIEEIAGMEAELVAPGESSFRSSVRNRNLGPLTILEFDVEPYQVRLASKLGSAPPEERLVLWLSIDGSGWVEQGGVTTELDPSILCVYGADRPRTFAFTTPSRGIALLMPLDPVRQALRGWELALPLNIDCTRGPGAVLADVVRSLARHADDPGEGMVGLADVLVALLAAVVSVLPGSLRLMPSRLEVFHKARIKRFVLEHLRDPALDVDTVSRAVGLSTRYIHKLFSSEPERLMKWVWAQRIEGACKEIERTASRRKAISQVAFSWGFSGPAHFSRSFRKRYGVSPIEYRSRAGARSKGAPIAE